ncbi:MAG: hypothetical protein MHMPM18_000344 [Marteilia pararefringens]
MISSYIIDSRSLDSKEDKLKSVFDIIRSSDCQLSEIKNKGEFENLINSQQNCDYDDEDSQSDNEVRSKIFDCLIIIFGRKEYDISSLVMIYK